MELARQRDWHLHMGVGITAAWLFVSAIYVFKIMGWNQFISQSTGEIAGFIEGAFAPLAFLWLVIGFFLQKRELTTNNVAIQQQYIEMKRTAENAEIQTRAIADSELHTRQETFMKVVEVINVQLGEICGLLYLSREGPNGENSVTQEEISDLWNQFAAHTEVFTRKLLGVYYTESEERFRDYLLGTEIRRAHTRNLIETFDRMLEVGGRCDPDGFLRDALRGSAHGNMCRLAREQWSRWEAVGGET